MTATYTFDVVSTLDRFGSYNEHGDWAASGARGGPMLDRRLARTSGAADGFRPRHLRLRGDAGLEHRGIRRGVIDGSHGWDMPTMVVSRTCKGL